jgi:hypothetical protein
MGDLEPIFTGLSRSVGHGPPCYFTLGELEGLLDDHEQGQRDHSVILWLV